MLGKGSFGKVRSFLTVSVTSNLVGLRVSFYRAMLRYATVCLSVRL